MSRSTKDTKKTRQAETAKVTIVFEGKLEFKTLFVNRVKRPFRNNKATAELDLAASHKLRWKVMGVPGAKWQYHLEPAKGYDIDPAKLKKAQKHELEKSSERLPDVSFKLVDKG